MKAQQPGNREKLLTEIVVSAINCSAAASIEVTPDWCTATATTTATTTATATLTSVSKTFSSKNKSNTIENLKKI